MKARVRATNWPIGTKDAERSTDTTSVIPQTGDEWLTSKDRAEYLESKGVVEILELIKEEPKKEVKKTEKKTTRKATTKKSNVAKK